MIFIDMMYQAPLDSLDVPWILALWHLFELVGSTSSTDFGVWNVLPVYIVATCCHRLRARCG